MSQEQNKKALGIAFALGMELLSMVLAGIFIGHYGGQCFNRADIGAILGCIAGLAAWTWRLIKTKRYIL